MCQPASRTEDECQPADLKASLSRPVVPDQKETEEVTIEDVIDNDEAGKNDNSAASY